MEAVKSTLLDNMDNMTEEKLTPEFAPFENGIESLTILMLMAAISDEYGVDVTAQEMKDARTLEGIHQLILSKKV